MTYQPHNEKEIKPESFRSNLFSGRNSLYSAIVLSLVISLALTFLFKNRMFLLILPIFPIQIAYRKIRNYFRNRKKS